MVSELGTVKCYPNEGRFVGTHVSKQLGESPFSASAPHIDIPRVSLCLCTSLKAAGFAGRSLSATMLAHHVQGSGSYP